jgi:hypothetical protein
LLVTLAHPRCMEVVKRGARKRRHHVQADFAVPTIEHSPVSKSASACPSRLPACLPVDPVVNASTFERWVLPVVPIKTEGHNAHTFSTCCSRSWSPRGTYRPLCDHRGGSRSSCLCPPGLVWVGRAAIHEPRQRASDVADWRSSVASTTRACP